MVDKRPTRRKRRAPAKNASGRKVPTNNARTPAEEPTVSVEALMRVPDFRQRVIRLIVRKLV